MPPVAQPPATISNETISATSSPARPRRRLLHYLGAVVVLLACGFILWGSLGGMLLKPAPGASSDEAPALPLPSKPSIAVLPLEYLGGDSGGERLSDGMTNDLITELSKFRDLFVISSTSTFTYKGKALRAPSIARKLGVRYVLEGTFYSVDDRVRTNVQLIDGITDSHVWAQRYDRRASDLFALQDEIGSTVVATLASRVNGAELKRVKRKDPTSLEAYDYYLHGREVRARPGPENAVEAAVLFEKAIALDPSYARAYTELAFVHIKRWILYGAPDRARDPALELVKAALELDPSDYRVHWVACIVHLYRWEHDLAMAAYDRAFELNPNDADMLAHLAEPLIYSGREEEAAVQIRRAMRLNPLFPDWYYSHLAWAYNEAGHHEQALESLQRIRADKHAWVRRDLVAAYVRVGRMEEARLEAARYLETDLDFSLEAEAAREKAKLPYKDIAKIDAYIEALRRAGLPE